jgi:hypothetical protein
MQRDEESGLTFNTLADPAFSGFNLTYVAEVCNDAAIDPHAVVGQEGVTLDNLCKNSTTPWTHSTDYARLNHTHAAA